jgi:hypothetical protein
LLSNFPFPLQKKILGASLTLAIKTASLHARSEILTAATMKSAVFWDVTPVWFFLELTFWRNALFPSSG